jgi:glutamate-1-semialdehyde 2,1-aminomutase
MAGSGQILYREARTRIPGGTQLLSKRPEMFLPEQWPSYYSRASGVDVWDLDDHHYLDMSYCAIGACILGCADPDVDGAVKAAIDKGSMSTLNCAEEVELARLLCELHPWAGMVRYARSGGESLAVAIRIARAHAGRDTVAFCGYHGWHDWYLAANLAQGDVLDGHLLPGLNPAGVPRGLAGTAIPFRYNRLDELRAIAERSELAAIVMEPARGSLPEPGFLQGVRDIADQTGAVLIFDEVTSGFRLNTGGIHLLLGVTPDMAVFAKALGNGYPMAAIIGTETVMQSAQDTFVSSTSWTERIGSTAALATIRKHRDLNVPQHLIHIGESVQRIWRAEAAQVGLQIEISGIAPLSHFSFVGYDNVAAMHTLFVQSMLDRDILAAKSFYSTLAHTDTHLERFQQAVGEVFKEIAAAVDRGDVSSLLRGPEMHAGFHRLT